MKKAFMKILSVALVLVMLTAVVPMNTAAADKIMSALPQDKLSFGVMSDMHYYPKTLTDNYCDSFMFSSNAALGREVYQSEAILDSALAAYADHAKKNDLKYLVIAGDLTSNGEYEAHIQLAKRLEQFEKDTGIQVIAINGNHDVENHSAETFATGKKAKERVLTPDEFLEVYKNLGYDIAYHKYTPTSGEANGLSYSVVDGNTRFIVMDTGIYSPDVTKNGEYANETAGLMTDEFLDWVLSEIDEAKAAGQTVVGVSHHNFMYHTRGEYRILRGFVINNFEKLGEIHDVVGRENIELADFYAVAEEALKKSFEVKPEALEKTVNAFLFERRTVALEKRKNELTCLVRKAVLTEECKAERFVNKRRIVCMAVNLNRLYAVNIEALDVEG